MKPEEIGAFLRDLRERKRLSLREAAKGVMSVTYLWQIEKGKRKASAEILKKIAPVYGEVPSEQRRKTLDQHGLVVYGYDGKNFLVHDPSPRTWALKEIPEDIFMYSWWRGKAYALLIRK